MRKSLIQEQLVGGDMKMVQFDDEDVWLYSVEC